MTIKEVRSLANGAWNNLNFALSLISGNGSKEQLIELLEQAQESCDRIVRGDIIDAQGQTCHDCGAKEGELHEPGCDMERCPFCGGQLISCSCCYKYVGLNYDTNKPYCGLPPEVYKNGLSTELEKKWDTILKGKGLIPYIVYPNICRRCGTLWPKGAMYPDWEWEYYVQKDQQDKVLCDACFQEIKRLINERSGRKPKLIACPFCKDNLERECVECRNTRTVNADFLPEQIRRYNAHNAMLADLRRKIAESP